MRAGFWIIGAAALFWVACSGDSTSDSPNGAATSGSPIVEEAQSPELDPTPIPSPSATTEAVPTASSLTGGLHEETPVGDPLSEPNPIICATPPIFSAPVNDRYVINGRVGDLITLKGASYFDTAVSGVEYEWVQVFAEQDSLHFTSRNLVELEQQLGPDATFIPAFPGVYRFGVLGTGQTKTDESFEIDVRIDPVDPNRFAVRGAFFPDLFGDNGGPGFDINPEIGECRDQALDHALAIAPRIGANWVAVTPAIFLTQINPTPVWGAKHPGLSMTDDDFYAAFIDAAHDRGLKVLQSEQDAPDFSITSDDMALWNESRDTAAYWDEWFNQWEPWAVERAARAEKFGVDMFSPFVWASDTFKPEIYPEYAERWLDLIDAIRGVYTGQVALSVSFFRPDLLTFVDSVDAVITGISSTYFPKQLGMPNDPSITEVIESAEWMMTNARDQFAGSDADFYYLLGAHSADGQTTSEDVNELATFVPDFQEQAIYYEALFQLIAREDWVDGVFIGVVDWFDQFARPEEGIYFDQTFQESPRSKPAEGVAEVGFTNTGG